MTRGGEIACLHVWNKCHVSVLSYELGCRGEILKDQHSTGTFEIVPPDALLIASLRAVGYSFKTAVADLIDNSIAAEASSITINAENGENESLYILDDGFGMSKDELRIAMKMAGRSVFSQRTANDLGRFGLGLKTASFSQAKKLSVISKKNGTVSGARWDLDYVVESGQWGLEWLSENEIQLSPGHDQLGALSSGTLVVWQNMDLFFSDVRDQDKGNHLSAELDEAAHHLALVFHRFLARPGRPLTITINSHVLKPFDPFLESSPQGVQPQPEESYLVEKSSVRVRPYILPQIANMTELQRKKALFDQSARESQGFYIYRGDRLLAWGNWYRIALRRETSKLARIKVDTTPELDSHWKLGVMKSDVTPPHSLVRALKPVVDRFVERAIRVGEGRSRNIVSEKQASWTIRSNTDGTFSLEVNRETPIFQRLALALGNKELKALTLLIKSLEANFPAQALHHHLANDQKLNVQNLGVKELQVYFDELSSNFEPLQLNETQLLDLIASLEPFSSTPQGLAFINQLRTAPPATHVKGEK